MVVEAHLVPDPDFVPRMPYKPTELDKRKASVDFLIQAVDGSRTTIRFNKEIVLPAKRGIDRCGSDHRVYYVTDRQLAKLKEKYSYECDF